MAEQLTRKDIFSRADLQSFRERQMADLEHRSLQTMSNHVAQYGRNGAPITLSELQDAIEAIYDFAKNQVDKMKKMGVADENIRIAVLGSIQNASIRLDSDHELKPAFNKMIEAVNNDIDNHIHQRIVLRQKGMYLR